MNSERAFQPPPRTSEQSRNVFSLEEFRKSQSANAASPLIYTLKAEGVRTAPPVLGEPTLKVEQEKSEREVRMSDPSREEINALIAASEARNETKLTRLEGKIDALAATISGAISENAVASSGQFEALKSQVESLKEKVAASDQFNHEAKTTVITTIIASALALAALFAGLFLGVATYGDAIFGRGMNVRDVVQAVVKEQQALQKGAAAPPVDQPTPAPQTPSNQPPPPKK